MKTTIVLSILLFAALIAVDRFDLLKTDPRYPPAVNRMIEWLQRDDFSLRAPFDEKQGERSGTPEIVHRTLYRWKNDRGVWVIGDQPPEKRLYETFTVSTDGISAGNAEPIEPTENTADTRSATDLKREARCRYAVEQIDSYKSKMQFGGSGENMNHWQDRLGYYRRMAIGSCATLDRAD